jgi:hypothetical protein
MGGIINRTDPLMIALACAAAMVGAWAIGWRQGRRLPPETGEDPAVKFTDASLALLGLLLAFTFSMSLARHDQRRATVVADSNAVGDFYTCASLLKQPVRSRLQGIIREYAQQKLDAGRLVLSQADLEKVLKRYQEMHARMTTTVDEAILGGTPIALSLTNTLNNVTSSSTSYLAAYRERLPWTIVLLLFLGAIVPALLVGLKQGASPRPHVVGTACFIILVAFVVYVTLDLNQPGSGAIRVSHEPFERLLESMEK